MNINLMQGDCLERMKELPDNSVDSIVTDPPYGLSDHSQKEVTDCLLAWCAGKEYSPKKKGFMGKEWDGWVPSPTIWKEALRVLKPGGHLLCFAGTRTMDLMSMSIRLSGFELRDSIGYANSGNAPLLAWVYSQGFPKSMDISKAIDKAAGAERNNGFSTINADITAPSTDEAKRWSGFGTQLKPAWEPIIMARKPLDGTVVNNVLTHGCGGINIDGCRVETKEQLGRPQGTMPQPMDWGNKSKSDEVFTSIGSPLGRFPANVIHDNSAEIIAMFPDAAGQQGDLNQQERIRYSNHCYGDHGPAVEHKKREDKTKSASRFFNGLGYDEDDLSFAHELFFYVPKTSTKDRQEGLNKDIDGKGNNHPTVKPTALMRHLVRLVTPTGGTTMDLFMGSGSTGKAAILEGFNFIGIELDSHYFEIAKARIEHAKWRFSHDFR
jgi:site-specific DNA-methyltransferase (adenine-specific)